MKALPAEVLVEHMREATARIATYTDGMTKADFRADERTQQAVILNLIILGEAAAKLIAGHPQSVANHPQISWEAMRGMRNRIAHGYYDTDLDVVWDTLTTSVAELDAQLSAVGF